MCQPLLFLLCKTEHPNPLFLFGSDLITYRCICIMLANFDLFQRLSCVHVHTHVLYWICACRDVCFALNVPSPSALHPPYLGGIWIDSANGIRICGFLALVQVLMLKFRRTFSDIFFLNMDSMCTYVPVSLASV